jgi:hypothetical protein
MNGVLSRWSPPTCRLEYSGSVEARSVVEPGAPLAPVAAGDGDWIGGFSILQADSGEAVAVLEGHPHTAMGGTIDIHEFMPPPDS